VQQRPEKRGHCYFFWQNEIYRKTAAQPLPSVISEKLPRTTRHYSIGPHRRAVAPPRSSLHCGGVPRLGTGPARFRQISARAESAESFDQRGSGARFQVGPHACGPSPLGALASLVEVEGQDSMTTKPWLQHRRRRPIEGFERAAGLRISQQARTFCLLGNLSVKMAVQIAQSA
jgi:hypothetical protein